MAMDELPEELADELQVRGDRALTGNRGLHVAEVRGEFGMRL